MKKPSIASLRLLLAALAPGNWRDTVNRHPKIANLIAVIIILLVVMDVGRQLGLPGNLFTARHSFASRPKPFKFLNVQDLHCPAQYITAMVSDGHGGAWVASEDSGIYHYQPSASPRWMHYDKANSPGLVSDHIYSLCLDAKGRLWAGTLRHGVCVYNGAKWGHYGLLNGPLGSHIFAIVENPYDKSVWMCTEAGVSIYHIAADSVGGGVGNTNPTRQFAAAGQWQYIPQATPGKPDDLTVNGLPPNPDCVAFNADGTAFVCTQCNGLAIGYPPYHSWWMVKGPWKVPIRPFGKDLPSNLINAVVAGKHGRIYVATDEGLAWDNPGNPYVFQYERGADYARKILGLWKPPARFKMPSRAFLNHLLPGDHITCLAVDKLGELWLGTWRNGLWINTLNHIAPRQGQIRELTPGVRRFSGALLARRRWWVRSIKLKKAGVHDITAVIGPQPPAPSLSRFVLNMFYVSAILPLADGQILIGHYGCGVTVGRLVPQTLMGRLVGTVSRLASDLEPGPFRHANLPTPARVPAVNQITALLGRLMHVKPDDSTGPLIIPLTDDWRTEGNWIDHYGRMWSLLYAMTGLDEGGGYDDVCFLRSDAWVNPYWRRGEAARHWLPTGWRNSTDPRVLQDILHGGRTQSNADDHGETYSDTINGPNLYETIELPVGQYIFSVYLLNDDGHVRNNRNRDYILQVSETPQLARRISQIGWYQKSHIQPVGQFNRSHPTAFSRCEYFWGGVYKRFYIRVAPADVHYRGQEMGCITLCIHRNYSFNTICEGLFIDPLGRLPWIRYGLVPRGVPEQPPMTLHYQQPVPPFYNGQPYIPTILGIPRPGHPFIVMHVKTMPIYAFDAGAVLQQLLYLRHANGAWFAQNGFDMTVELTRFIFGYQGNDGRPAAYFYKSPPQALYSGGFLASQLRGVGLSTVADRIYPPMSRYMPASDEYWAWTKRTKNPKITDQQIWPLPKIFKLYHLWWEKQFHRCLTLEDSQ